MTKEYFDKPEYEKRASDICKFPISYNIENNDFEFYYCNNIKVDVSIILTFFKLDEVKVYKEYNMEYLGFDYFRMREEDADRFVRYINSLALLNKI